MAPNLTLLEQPNFGLKNFLSSQCQCQFLMHGPFLKGYIFEKNIGLPTHIPELFIVACFWHNQNAPNTAIHTFVFIIEKFLNYRKEI